MLSKMRNKLRISWGQASITSLIKLPKLLSAAELARSSWAVRIKSYEDVPDVFKDFFKPFLEAGQAFPYTILTPTQERFINRQTEKLISDLGSEIYVLKKSGNIFETQCYPIGGISYLEFRNALLASSFKICGMTSREVYISSTLIFNSVTDYLFKPILYKARPGAFGFENATENQETEKFEGLAKVNFKFMNFARHSLSGGEKVLHFVLQPEMKESILTFLRKTYYRTISPTHMLILTDRELITIREEAIQGARDRYGGIWDYIPVDKIDSLSVSEEGNNLLRLIVQLPEDISFGFLFHSSLKEELDQIMTSFKGLAAK